jgi:uncharacterized protein (DUF1330 family)
MSGATDEPIAMFNALWFRPNGLESYARYAEAVMPILADVGADMVTPFLPLDDALEGGFDPFVTGFVRYPSAAAFDEMWQSSRYREVAHLRTDAVERAVLTRCRLEPADAPNAALVPGVVVLNMLWFHDGGRERYDDYLEAAAPLVAKVGGRYVSPRFLPDKAYGDEFVPDLVFLGNYPSREAVFDLVGDADYAPAAAIRTAAVARSVTTTLRVH